MARILLIVLALPSRLEAGDRGRPRRPDGAVRVAACPGAQSCQNPVFSPDGRLLLFTRFRNGYNRGPSELVRVARDGTQERVLIPAEDSDNVNASNGSWVGRRLCWASDRAGGAEEIFAANDDGSGVRRLTSHPAGRGSYVEPVFNPVQPDLILFEHAPPGRRAHRIKLMDSTSGGRPRDLTGGGPDDRLPSWSPDGRKVLFQRADPGDDRWTIYVAELSTGPEPSLSGLRAVSPDACDATDASWARGGRLILASSDCGGLAAPNILAFAASGTGAPIRITRSDLEDGAPSSSPDGKWIAFESHVEKSPESRSEIWIIPAPDPAAAAQR